MDWTLLGIEPTKDKKAITAAYRGRLTQVNPEDKPEEFKALRGAYEEALRLADQEDAPSVRDESPVGLWMERVRSLYDDFQDRIRIESWKELLSDPVCVALDKRPLAEEALLKFLLEDFYIPQAVWQLLDETFAWSERREELYESYPRDFVDYAVLNGIRYPAALPYELFDPGCSGKDCDEYRRLYHRANQLAAGDLEPVLEQMASLSERHPYGDALTYRLMMESGEAEKGREGYRSLAESYPDDPILVMAWAAQCANMEQWEECEKLTRHVLELRPDHGQAKRLLADALAGQGRQEEAKEQLFALMDSAGGDQKQIYQLTQVVRTMNEVLIPRYQKDLKEGPDNHAAALKLGWCLLQNDRSDEALAICEQVPEDYRDPYDHHNLWAKVLYSMDRPEEAAGHLERVVEIQRALEPDGTEETARRIRRLPEMLQILGSCLMRTEQRQQALEYYEEALAMAPEHPEILTNMAHLLYSQKDYLRAVEILERLTACLPGSYHGYLLLSLNLYKLGRDRDAFDAINRALELERGDLGVYVLKMRILLRNGVWDGVREILDFLAQNDITDEISVAWCKAQLTEYADRDKEQALKQYYALAHRIEQGEHLNWASQVYYRIAVLMADNKDARKQEDRAALLEVLDQGLEYDPEDADCMDYKAWLLKRDKRIDEALELYHKLEKKPRRNLNVEQELAELYYRNLTKNAEKALYYYQKLLDHEEHPYFHFYAGTCRRYLGDWKGAEKNFLQEQKLAPEDVDGYNGLGLVYEAMGRYEEALVQAEKAIELVKDREDNQSRYYFRKVQILRRLCRPQEAAEVVREIDAKYGHEAADWLIFDIYCQFGLWAEAQNQLQIWRKNDRKKQELAAAEIKLELYRDQLSKAKFKLMCARKNLGENDLDNLQLQIAELEGSLKPQVKIWKKRLESGSDRSHALMNLAQAYCWDGDLEQAREYAAQALEELDEQLKLHLKNGALYRSRRAMALAILGREDEAWEELKAVRAMALCESCDYGKCKDADIFEANMYEVFGDYRRAMELHRRGRELWPDDLDFASGIARMKRKGF